METPEIFRKLRQNPESWLELRDMLQTALATLPRTDWCPEIPRPSAKQTGEEEKEILRRGLHEAYTEHVQSVAEAVISYLPERQWPELQPPTVYYLRQMLARTGMFLQSIVFDNAEGPSTIFPFPGDDPIVVFLWFLTEWWHAAGLNEVIFEATTDQALFRKYFGS